MEIVLIGGFEGIEKKNILFSIGNQLTKKEKRVAIVTIEDEEKKEKESLYLNPMAIVKEMENIPCTFITDLMVELPQNNEISNSEYLLIEVPFSLAPAKVKEYLSNLELNELSFAPTIYVFDANNFKGGVKIIPKIVSKQIMESDIIVTSTNPIDQKTIEILGRTFKDLNPHASLFMYDPDSEGHKINDFVDMISI